MVRIADAPILEGTMNAVVQAACEGKLDDVVFAAESARGILKL